MCSSAAAGRRREHSNPAIPDKKCARLKVTRASALPLMAVSKTISSSGSISRGLQRNERRAGLAIAAKSSSTVPTSTLLNPDAAKCSGLVSTASYSSISGTESNKPNRSSKAASRSWREAPSLLRSAATTTSVSRTYKTGTGNDIACNINR